MKQALTSLWNGSRVWHNGFLLSKPRLDRKAVDKTQYGTCEDRQVQQEDASALGRK